MTVTGLQQKAQTLATQPLNRRYVLGKRALDLFFCLSFLPFGIIIMAAIALAIYLDSPGPPIFVQERIGKGGKKFKMYKFRTMRHDYNVQGDRAFMQAFITGDVRRVRVAGNGTRYKPVKPEHVTRFGRMLRNASLDELPQLFNVLKGEMSLVGPRPNVPWEVEKYQEWHYARLAALPGITGLAQVNGRSDITFDEIVGYDIEYIKSQSLLLDLRIIWATVSTVLAGQGAG